MGHIVSLMRSNIDVAIVTAAGYPGAPERFEQRVAGLLAAFQRLKLPKDVTDRSAQCNGTSCSIDRMLWFFHRLLEIFAAAICTDSKHVQLSREHWCARYLS